MRLTLNWFDRVLLSIAPRYGLTRIRARAAADLTVRHYEAAMPTHRTSGWKRSGTDADLTVFGAFIELRMHARDLIRNNAWAKRAQRVIANNTVGYGIRPRALGGDSAAAMTLWKNWAGTVECESEGRHTFYGVQRQAMRTIVESGEVLIRRRYRKVTDDLTIPIQLQVLEPDYLDHSRMAIKGPAGGPIIQGIEFDAIGRRAAYWLFANHPGSGRNYEPAKRIPAEDVLHIYYRERAGQSRGISWFAPAVLPLKDFDEYEDATLLKQKIAACFAAFVQDMDGSAALLGAPGDANGNTSNSLVETLEPGQVNLLPPGKQITFANPPSVTEEGFRQSTLRKIAAGMGVTYEDLTLDYSQVNFSSARMSRIAHWGNVIDWQQDMLIPLLCQGVWDWAMQAALAAGEIKAIPQVDWTPSPMPMLEPDKEALAYTRALRAGLMTHAEMLREQGSDLDSYIAEQSDALKKLDAAGIVLDSDPRKTTATGQEQPSQAAPEENPDESETETDKPTPEKNKKA